MKWFKRKYKKSEWFEGLLWAESVVNKFGIDNLKMYIYQGAHDPYEFESDRGADHYYKNILDEIENKYSKHLTVRHSHETIHGLGK